MLVVGHVIWDGADRSWAEEPLQSSMDGAIRELSQEIKIAGQSEGNEVGSLAVGKPSNPTLMPQKFQSAMSPTPK